MSLSHPAHAHIDLDRLPAVRAVQDDPSIGNVLVAIGGPFFE